MSTTHTSRIALGAVLFASFAIVIVGASNRKWGLFSKSSQETHPRVANKTRSIQVLNVRRLVDGDVEVTWTNQSTSAIYAYTIVTAQQPTRKGVTTFVTAAPVQPGESKSERISQQNLKSGAGTSSDDPGEIVFSATYLEGGTTDGDQRDSGKLKRTMEGMKERAKLVLEILRSSVSLPEQDTSRLLDLIESQVASASPKNSFEPTSKEREDGKAMVTERILSGLKSLRKEGGDSGADVKAKLLEMITYYERLSTKL